MFSLFRHFVDCARMSHLTLTEEWIGSDSRDRFVRIGKDACVASTALSLTFSSAQLPSTTTLYQRAIDRFAHDGTRDERKIAFAQQSTSLRDVESVVSCAKKEYQTKRNSKPYKWLGRVSTRLVYYGNIFDVLAQHHPEYVALAWGAMKLLFVVSV